MQETFYRVVPCSFDEQLLESIYKFKPLLLEAMGRFRVMELVYMRAMQTHVEIGLGGGFGMRMERGVNELEELLGSAKETPGVK